MTNFKRLQTMTVNELAEWLDKNGSFDVSPWSEWFSKKYCDNCESVKCKYEDTEKTLGFTPYQFGYYNGNVECSYCELEKKCKFFSELEDTPDNFETIKMWLGQEVEENTENSKN